MFKTFFAASGVHAVVDGQFGSTGKGVLAAFLAKQAIEGRAQFGVVVSNAGPNSGHTFYHGDEKHVLKQLPTFAVAWHLLNYEAMTGLANPPVFLSAGAIIDPEILAYEASKYPDLQIIVHPMAAVITQDDKEAEHSGTIQQVAGTRSGTGAVLARKVLRDPTVTFKHFWERNMGYMPRNVDMQSDVLWNLDIDVWDERVFMEVSQGFSLGLNSDFYPKVTSRECTVMQGLSDARLPARSLERVYLSMRTFPIRVGNHEGFSSGDCYPDQVETTWEAIGQTPELTTVTQRVRRVFTFSDDQAHAAIEANDPDFVFMNFMNYLDEDGALEMRNRIDNLRDDARQWFDVLWGYGPKSEDLQW